MRQFTISNLHRSTAGCTAVQHSLCVLWWSVGRELRLCTDCVWVCVWLCVSVIVSLWVCVWLCVCDCVWVCQYDESEWILQNYAQTKQYKNTVNTSTLITKTLTQLAKHPHTHTLQNPHIQTPTLYTKLTRYKTHTYSHPPITKPTHTHSHTH